MQASSYFITAIDTDIGKTFLLENICKIIANIQPLKPIITGYNENKESDISRILDALRIEKNSNNINSICPWRYEKAASPHIAASAEINFLDLINFCRKNIQNSQLLQKNLFIEGAGGVNSPINNKKTFADLMQELNLPAILVTANFLGSISQTICAIESLKLRNIKVKIVILNNLGNQLRPKSEITDQNFLEYIENYSKVKIVKIDDFLKNPLDLLQKKENT